MLAFKSKRILTFQLTRGEFGGIFNDFWLKEKYINLILKQITKFNIDNNKRPV